MIAVSDTLYINPNDVGSVFADEEGIILIIQGVRHTLRWSTTSPASRGREIRNLVLFIEENTRA